MLAVEEVELIMLLVLLQLVELVVVVLVPGVLRTLLQLRLVMELLEQAVVEEEIMDIMPTSNMVVMVVQVLLL